MPDPRDFLPPPPWEGPPIPGGIFRRPVLREAEEYLGRIHSDASLLFDYMDKLKVDFHDIAALTVEIRERYKTNPRAALTRVEHELLPSLQAVGGRQSYMRDIAEEMLKDTHEILARGL